MSRSTEQQGFEGGEVPFVMGEVYGLRAFHISSEGELLGCSYRIPWVDGENVAQCLANNATFPERNPFWWSMKPAYYTPPSKYVAPREIGKEHPLTGCECGFWAYKTTQNTYRSTYHAAAIIRGYGRVIVGEKGYRVQRAHIEALNLPTQPELGFMLGAAEERAIRLSTGFRAAVAGVRERYLSPTYYDLYDDMIQDYKDRLERKV